MDSKKVIVTGVSGQLGSYMVDFLIENTDYQILGAVRRTSKLRDEFFSQHLKNPRFKIVHFDLRDVHSITSLIKNENPDYFINFAAQTFVADSWKNPVEHFETNALSLIHILEAVKNFAPNCRVYSSGSSEQFGDVNYSPQDINHPFKSRSPYGASKVSAHHIVKTWRESYNLYVVQGILFNNESPRRGEYFVSKKITKEVARIKKEIDLNLVPKPMELGNLNAQRDWSYSLDFVDGVWKMLNQSTWEGQDKKRTNNKPRGSLSIPKDYILASGETHSIREFVEESFDVAGFRKSDCHWSGEGVDEKYVVSLYGENPTQHELVKVNPKFYRPAEVELLLGDSTPAREELGWKPKTDFKGLVKKMVENDLK